MPKAGQMIENVLTKEKIRFIQTASDTNGQLLRFDMFVPKGGSVVHHIHPRQLETIQVVTGRMRLYIDGTEHILNVGDKCEIPPGARHEWFNDTEDDLHFIEELSPALRWEDIFMTLFNIANDGKAWQQGFPNPFWIAVMMDYYYEHVWFAFASVPLQRVAVPVLAALGRLAGYRPMYPYPPR